MNYHTGDIVHVSKFPYERDIGIEPKGRYGIVIHNDDINDKVYVMGITSRHQRTQNNSYHRRSYEVAVPEEVSLYGVVRTDMFRAFNPKELRHVREIDNDTLFKINQTYKYNIDNHVPFTKSINAYCPNHKEIMNKFTDEMIARKLNFLSNSPNKNYYDELRNKKIQITEIGEVGRFGKGLNVYDITLETKKAKFDYRYTTDKNLSTMINYSTKQRTGESILKSDFKYKVLSNNFDKTLKEDRLEAAKKEPINKLKQKQTKEQDLN